MEIIVGYCGYGDVTLVYLDNGRCDLSDPCFHQSGMCNSRSRLCSCFQGGTRLNIQGFRKAGTRAGWTGLKEPEYRAKYVCGAALLVCRKHGSGTFSGLGLPVKSAETQNTQRTKDRES